MIKYTVIGDPVAHSRSPGMQNAAFERAGLGRPYGRKHVTAETLPLFIGEARRNLLGVNITVPHKEAVIPFLDEIDELALRCRSVNTLCIRSGKIKGYSTDGYGLEYALRENFALSPAGKIFCFAGCGGACRAAAVHLAAEGAQKIILINRTRAKAEDIAGIIEKHFPRCGTRVLSLEDAPGIAEALKEADSLIQSTSLGLREEDPPPFDLDLLEVNPALTVFDTIYKNTPLLRKAGALGLRCAGGRAMLIHQGAQSFRLWTGLEPDIAAMNEGFDITPVTNADAKE